MYATTVAVDLAKSVFQIAISDDKWKVIEQQRLTRSQFERWFHNREVGLVVHGSLRFSASLGLLAQSTGHRGEIAARRLYPGLCKTEQDRCRRCLRLA